MNNWRRAVLPVCIALSVTSCSWLAGPEDDYIGDTLADLRPAKLPDVETTVPDISLEDIEESYHRALDVAQDDEVRRKILIRLAGLEMIRSEQNQLDATEAGQFFTDSISMYEELIRLQEGRPGRDKLIYQLAKAYALDGRSEEAAATLDQLAREYPDSKYIDEAQFRRAERAFSNSDYQSAEEFYSSVVNSEEQSPYKQNAVYMLGWTQFKRNNYDAALLSFTEVLDGLFAGRETTKEMEGPQRNLAEDTLYIMSVIFSYLDGAETIRDTYAVSGERPYNHLLYQRLGDLYLEKERFRDSADTYTYYVNSYPLSDYAPEMSVRIIDVYDQGDFPSELLPAKEDFVNKYGIHSAYWTQKSENVHEELRGYLHVYLEELAKYEHSQAQSKQNPQGENLRASAIAKMQAEAPTHFERAARFYEEFSVTFPDDPKTHDMVFLLGEAYYESGQLAKAVDAYEKVAYEYVDDNKGAEAGYSAILAMDELVAATQDPERAEWLQHKTDSSITFADYYPGDERAPNVLATGAQNLLNKGANLPAVEAAMRLTNWQPQLDASLLKTAWLIVGQGQFEMGLFSESEFAYRQVLAMMPANQPANVAATGPSREQVVERISAAMFKQAEEKLAGEDKAGAVDQLLQISAVSPGTDIAIKAEYDAATYLMEMQQWDRAAQVLTNFRRAYPTHQLTATLPPKLVVIYQEMQEWQLAADELSIMANNDSDPDVRRQSQFLSAELFEQSGNVNSAINAYRDYADKYRQPFDQNLEAQNKLVELYTQTGNQQQRRVWMNQIIRSDAQAGSARTGRSKTLAAKMSSEFADELYQNFKSIPLTLPIKDSLGRKRNALDNTLKAYEQILDYGVAEYSTLASYRIGEIYAQLSKDLMDSERPADLDELAMEQYTILLEEQAFPFEEQAIEIHEANVQRTQDGVYDNWVKESFKTLARLLPARYNKQEEVVDVSENIH